MALEGNGSPHFTSSVRMSFICNAVGTLTIRISDTNLDDVVGEVLPNVNALGPFASADDVVTPLNARGVVLVDRGRLLLPEPKTE